jgi:CRISPR-associated protein Cmr2
MLMDLSNLIRLKIDVLFHDPPHKSFLINILGDSFGSEHEKHASGFRSKVLNGTKFLAVGGDEVKGLVKFCDVASSTIERRLLRLKYWPKGKYLRYNKLHNIFDPVSDGVELVLNDPNNIIEVGKELNEILSKIYGHVDDVTFYNVLYIAYELLWYSYGLLPSLADTRIPTHTVFDHLYSCTTIANTIMEVDNKVKLGGFYVVTDFPGIQRFVGSGRKAGDFWASSWLLSNVMWGVAEYFARKYGFDVIISPTPRLNPYTLKSIKSWLNDIDAEVMVIEKLKKAFTKAFKISEDELEELIDQPIIPATITLILPTIDLKYSEDVVKEISRAYISSWNSIVNEVFNKLESSGKPIEKFIHNHLSSVKDVISLPPSGIRIFVVDISKLYEALSKCIVDNDIDVCNNLGLKIDVKKLTNIIKSSGINYDDVILILLWHLMSTKATELASKFGSVRIPVPRPFWIFNDDMLRPISDKFVDRGGWESCILCNSEPATIKLSKRVVKRDEREEIDFEERIEGLSDRDLQEFKKHFKPGEALGPYCLLKRAIYIVNIGRVKFVSTDDVLLGGTSNILLRLDTDYKFLRKLEESEDLREFDEGKRSLVMSLIKSEKGLIKDIDLIASMIETTYDGLVNMINRSVLNVCKELSNEHKVRFIGDTLRSLTLVTLGDEYIISPPNELKLFTDNPSVVRVDGICKAISIPKTFAIVRCDGDNIGKFLNGEKPLGLDEYASKLLTIIEGAIKNSGIDEGILNYVRDGFNTLKELLSSLGFTYIPVSPARTAATSLALMTSAINDLRIVRSNYGMMIFSGGDDVLALTPSQTALKTAVELRRSFSDEYFRRIGNVVIPTIPTGRSVSVRFVNIADLMNYELSKTLELLEDLGKKCKWLINGREYPKDTLVVSDSRIGITALLPLHKDLRKLTNTALIMGFLVGIGIISSNTPNDFINMVKDPKLLNEKGLEIITKYIIGRNIVTSTDRKSYAENFIKLLNWWFNDGSNVRATIDGDVSNLINEVMNLLMIMRREL